MFFMAKKETYLTCDNTNVYEGMTSISAIIKKFEERGDCQKINKIFIDKEKIKSKSREISFLRHKSTEIGFEIEFTDSQSIDRLTTGTTHGGIIALCDPTIIPPLSENIDKIKPDGIYVMLDGIEDPYNFGYSVRSIYASGADGVIVSPRNWMTVSGIVAKSSAGASELIDMFVADPQEAIALFKNIGYKIVCSGIRNSVSMYDADMKKPIFLIVGGEKRGISSNIESMADVVARVEYGREFRGSLSAASAATIMVYEIFRQNRTK
jgi:23S rRNA (guanosine2251-2'-O)-methyltransferase